MTTWLTDDAAFRRELLKGRRVEEAVAVDILLDLYLGVKVFPLEYREQQGDDFNDQVDILVEGGHLLEVKGRNLVFTERKDYPFSTVFCGNDNRWRKRKKRPCHFVIVSTRTGARIAISTATADTWIHNKSSYDSVRGMSSSVLEAPRDLVMPWEYLVDHLKSGRCDRGA